MRRTFFGVMVPLFALSVAFGVIGWTGWWFPLLVGALLALGIRDALQRQHTILRNFPVLGHMRYLLESVRPEIQQYFVEHDVSSDPIARIYRAVVYQRAKGDLETVSFGSQLDFYAKDYQWVNHSSFPIHLENSNFRVTIGNDQCRQPYSTSLFNISAMSFGSISKPAVQALGRGAKLGMFALNTGEGGVSPYHLEAGADLTWQIGTAYFGCRDQEGLFSETAFRETAIHPQIKMIELKISQGAKPGHGGILPGVKVDAEIAHIRRVPEGRTVFSPPYHSAFRTPKELCHFIQRLRDLSDGKPVGIKFCLGKREEFVHLCEAIRETGICPDFITVDGSEGGTGAAPFEFINYVGSPLNEALLFVNCTLERFGLREKVKINASGKVFSGFNIFEKLALGADFCGTARGMMLALGCIQALRCNNNNCPTGIATNRPSLYKGLDVTDKSVRVANYHRKTLEGFRELLGAAGLRDPAEIDMSHISRRENGRVVNLKEIYGRTTELSPEEQTSEFKPPTDGVPYPPLRPTE